MIFVSSGVVKQARPFWGAYAVSKAGLESVRGMLFEELEGEANIRINSVNPGRMRTAMRAAAYPAEDPEHRAHRRIRHRSFFVLAERTRSRY